MSAIGITTTYGITLPSTAKAQKVDRVRSVGFSEVPGTDGECLLVKPLNVLKTEVTVSGKGPPDLSSVTVGTIGTPATLSPLRIEQGEVNDDRCTFTMTYTGHGTVSSSSGGSAGAGSPDEHTINVVSLAYSLTKDCRISAEVDDVLELTPAGIPGFRGTVNKRLPFSGSGKGDIPSNLGPGAAGAKHALASAGATVTTSVTDTQEARAVNSWSFDATNWPAATAG